MYRHYLRVYALKVYTSQMTVPCLVYSTACKWLRSRPSRSERHSLLFLHYFISRKEI